ncbi:MAG: hypothetical protein KA257_04815 [Opitutaceae bacterium]|nr:hypothetical protein [Opitutaceae bacterium]MBP9912297.1 hypothetical protein [Opitutaceae bacterium]
MDDRIHEKAGLYASLSPQTQDDIQHGQVRVGYTREMVYVSLGKPNGIVASADGRVVVWTYMNFNTPDGSFMLTPKHVLHNPVDSVSLLFTGGDWQGVTGRADLNEGAVAVPNEKVRRKTAMEMIAEESRQDLQIKFLDGQVVDFQLIRS